MKVVARRLLCAVGLAVPALVAVAAPEGWMAQVSRVTDGDTVWVRPVAGGAPIKVRLAGLDAPERCQHQGLASTKALAGRLMQQTVRVEPLVEDDYGRLVARLWRGRQDVGAAHVAAGWAWSDHFRGRPGAYAAEELEARAARRGLFREDSAEQPSHFRQRHGPCPMRAP